ncbi:hypothetical protein HWV62_31754 [Athelia sp. TMB]|nr:hypothetical protein HWV62_31754 [Athelia sp. TMB]
MSRPKIIIIGAGLGGLALAQSLRSHGLEFEIYERDEGKYSRNQGWALSLHWIIPFLRKIAPKGTPDLRTVSVSVGQPEPDGTGMYDAYSKKALSFGVASNWQEFIRANRAKLRDYLATSIEIKWGKRFTGYDIGSDGRVSASFEDGSVATGDILVGADGLRSTVRHILYKSNPPPLNVVPVGVIAGNVTLNREQTERQAVLGRSFYVVIAKKLRFFVGLRSYSDDGFQGDFYWLFFFPDEAAREPSFWINNASPERLLEFVNTQSADFHPDLKAIIGQTKPEDMSKPFVMHDCVPEVYPPGPITLIGDASHPMTPFRGEGANNAMQDAIELGEKLAAAVEKSLPIDINDCLRAYEKEMIPRAKKSVIESRAATMSMFKY